MGSYFRNPKRKEKFKIRENSHRQKSITDETRTVKSLLKKERKEPEIECDSAVAVVIPHNELHEGKLCNEDCKGALRRADGFVGRPFITFGSQGLKKKHLCEQKKNSSAQDQDLYGCNIFMNGTKLNVTEYDNVNYNDIKLALKKKK